MDVRSVTEREMRGYRSDTTWRELLGGGLIKVLSAALLLVVDPDL